MNSKDIFTAVAAEREACARLADERGRERAAIATSSNWIQAHAAREIAEAIRRRGEAQVEDEFAEFWRS